MSVGFRGIVGLHHLLVYRYKVGWVQSLLSSEWPGLGYKCAKAYASGIGVNVKKASNDIEILAGLEH